MLEGPERRAPLTHTSFHILLSLAEGPLHGYAVMQQLADVGLRVGPGTIYGALHRMEESGWVECGAAEKSRGPLGQRQRYNLTAVGRRILQEEAKRVVHAAEIVRRRAVLTDRGDA